MGQPTVAIVAARFADPEEGTTATVDRLVLAAAHHRVTHEALKTLIALTALACASNHVVGVTARAADIDELESRKLIHQNAHNTVVLL